jgi:hypothetical protein
VCLPDFKRFEQIDENNPLTGYRVWRIEIKNPTNLISENLNYRWIRIIEGPHEIKETDSGIYSYNNRYNYFDKYYNNDNNYSYNDDNDNNNYTYNKHNRYYNCNYNYNYNYKNSYYYIVGIIHQWGRVAIHERKCRSEYAKIITLFTIREIDAEGSMEFTNWIREFNEMISKLANKYEANTMHWQDFK